jgi:hypothetical protein
MFFTCVPVSEFKTDVVIPDAVKAASSGAKTVKGPVPLNVPCKSALRTAVSSVEKL